MCIRDRPDTVSLEEGAMVEPISVGVQALRQSAIKPGQSAVVQGLGAIGLSIMQVLLAHGVHDIIAIEPLGFRREFAAAHGAPIVLETAAQATALLLERGREGVQFVFEAAGDEAAIEEAVALADLGGTLLIAGIIASDEFRLTQSVARSKELTILFARRSNDTMRQALRLIAHGKVNVRDYATHVFPFVQVEEAYRLSEARPPGLLRAVVRVDQ